MGRAPLVGLGPRPDGLAAGRRPAAPARRRALRRRCSGRARPPATCASATSSTPWRCIHADRGVDARLRPPHRPALDGAGSRPPPARTSPSSERRRSPPCRRPTPPPSWPRPRGRGRAWSTRAGSGPFRPPPGCPGSRSSSSRPRRSGPARSPSPGSTGRWRCSRRRSGRRSSPIAAFQQAMLAGAPRCWRSSAWRWGCPASRSVPSHVPRELAVGGRPDLPGRLRRPGAAHVRDLRHAGRGALPRLGDGAAGAHRAGRHGGRLPGPLRPPRDARRPRSTCRSTPCRPRRPPARTAIGESFGASGLAPPATPTPTPLARPRRRSAHRRRRGAGRAGRARRPPPHHAAHRRGRSVDPRSRPATPSPADDEPDAPWRGVHEEFLRVRAAQRGVGGRGHLGSLPRQAAQEPRPARAEVRLPDRPLPGLREGRQGGAEGHAGPLSARRRSAVVLEEVLRRGRRLGRGAAGARSRAGRAAARRPWLPRASIPVFGSMRTNSTVGGAAKSVGGRMPTAACMNPSQPGSAAPAPVACGPSGSWLSKPTQTPATRSGVMPTNQASRCSWAVPVLAATGRSSALAACPVPLCTTSFIMATVT